MYQKLNPQSPNLSAMPYTQIPKSMGRIGALAAVRCPAGRRRRALPHRQSRPPPCAAPLPAVGCEEERGGGGRGGGRRRRKGRRGKEEARSER
uniref:Uncharacterized protein n=1 Tax=Oryza sativa subsp. japonica TaxID=39947 RepID=Q6Z9V6_ORYSJ|nr:hypothetical protein [Oryza sativa Japonica Group]BAC99619.1 hypothetical protein [Oryza sativa Japonica Group]